MNETQINEPKEMERLIDELGSINNRVNGILTTVSNINDRFFGDIPREDKGCDTVASSGAIGDISDKLEYLCEMLSKIESETNKASKIV